MTIEFTLNDILEKAIEKEIESRLVYTDLSKRTKDKAIKDAFLELARQEQGHQKMLEKYQRGEFEIGMLDRGKAIDYKIAEHFDQPKIASSMQLKDVFLLAANREMRAHQFYLYLASIHPRGEVKKLLKELASQELVHKRKVEFLYTEVAFTQTAGG
jgi:rubrerythrin